MNKLNNNLIFVKKINELKNEVLIINLIVTDPYII